MTKVLMLNSGHAEYKYPYKCVIIDYPYKPLDKPNWEEFVRHCEQLKELAKTIK